MLSEDRYFDPDPVQKSAALDLYYQVRDLPIISPHGHVNPALFADPAQRFGNPVELFLQPDHYVLRMLNSQGISYDLLLSDEDPRRIWQVFAEHFHLFLGTPTGLWLAYALESVFEVQEKLTPDTAGRIYDRLVEALSSAEFSARALFERFRIEILATTDAATDTLEHHQTIQKSGWRGRIIPTFRPDGVTDLKTPSWRKNIDRLSRISGIDVNDYRSYISALEQRRADFKSLGATATDSAALTPNTQPLSDLEAEQIFQRALAGKAAESDAARFSANMLYEMARMSVEDGLVMQLHPGSWRNHNTEIFERFGADRGFDIPVITEYTNNLRPLLENFGNHPNFSLIVFTLDETTYSRELAPLAGAYRAVKLGPPWWFFDSWNGLRRYFDQVMETAGVYNTAGFNDDTRAFLSIPARHDVWRRACANWLAGLQVRGMIERSDAQILAIEMAAGLAKKAYRL